MDRAQAADNVVPIAKSPEPSELELARRLADLLEMRQIEVDEREAAEARAAELREREAELDLEIVAIKRKLGGTAKRKKGSRPTRAASSSSSRATLKQKVWEIMERGRQLAPREVVEMLGVTSHHEKQTIHNLLRAMWERGDLVRNPVGKSVNGRKAYAYVVKS